MRLDDEMLEAPRLLIRTASGRLKQARPKAVRRLRRRWAMLSPKRQIPLVLLLDWVTPTPHLQVVKDEAA